MSGAEARGCFRVPVMSAVAGRPGASEALDHSVDGAGGDDANFECGIPSARLGESGSVDRVAVGGREAQQ